MKKYYKFENSIMVVKPSDKLAVGLLDATQFIMYPYPHGLTFNLYEQYLDTRKSCEILESEFDKWMKVYNSLLSDFEEFSNYCETVLKEQGFR